jgi:UDP-3-O-[3-hydroxymyristoyl] glucosamine N-acyltransferase
MMTDPIFFTNFGPFSLKEIAKISESVLRFPAASSRDQDFLINDVAPMDLAEEHVITFLANKKYLPLLAKTNASACFIEEKYVDKAPANMILLISGNPYKSYALTASAFYPTEKRKMFIGKNISIHSSSTIGVNHHIEPNVCIGANVVIGNNCYIGAGSVIADGVIIGDNCHISSCVTISHTIIGDDVLIHPGARIGQDGFGFASDRYGHYKIPQLGRVLIGNKVEIGANTCIDRGSGNDTIIEDGCMIDNLVQIGHNVKLGKNSVIVAQVGISGSTKLGDFVVVGGQVGISGHLNIGTGAKIAARSGVIKDVEAMEEQGGYPAIPIMQWHRQTILLKKLAKKGNKTND